MGRQIGARNAARTSSSSDNSSRVDDTPEAGGGRLGRDERYRRPGQGWVRWTWRTLTSMRTAVVLLALLAAAAVPGSLLPQRNVASNPSAVTNFYLEHPDLAPLLDRASLFDVYASPWFAAVYLLLLTSMTGCVVPRCLKLWRAVRAKPLQSPRHLGRLEHYVTVTSPGRPDELLERAAQVLRRRRFRVVVTDAEVRAERGYVRELGNLTFHLSLLVLLVGIGAGRLFGFEGRVAMVEGSSFANVRGEYDAFTPSVWTDVEGLEPVVVTLDEFEAAYATEGARRGEPRSFAATLSYAAGDGDEQTTIVSPNAPLDVNGTKFFLTGHGYAPVVTVRDGRGDVVVSGPVIFLPVDTSFASDGVVKAPDARPDQLAFEGTFLPTAAVDDQGRPYSLFPDALNPRLVLAAYSGALGIGDGTPESVYTLDTAGLDAVPGPDGLRLEKALSVGETMVLPDGQGSLTFDGVAQFANFQIAYDPGKEISLMAAVLLLIGLTTSLCVGRRQVWVRVRSGQQLGGSQGRCAGPRATSVEIACRSVTKRAANSAEVHALARALSGTATATTDPEETRI